MKKITVLLLLITSYVYCQSGTTLEEYNYMTKGYKIQVSSGLDVKKGYSIKDMYVYVAGDYVFDYKAFIRDDKSLSGIILVATSKVWGNVYYLCIPINQPDMLKLFNLNVQLWDEPMTTAYSESSTYMFSSLFAGYYLNSIDKLNLK